MTSFAALRRHFLILTAAALLAACSGGDDAPGSAAARPDTLVDMVYGQETAPVELIEYASTTCPACAAYHKRMKDTIFTLADEGKLRYVFREFPRNQVDIAGFATARCAGDDKFFDVLDDLFEKQQGLGAASRNGTIRTALQTLASQHGVDEAGFEACLEDPIIRGAISNAALAGEADEVTETPTLFLNGVKLSRQEGRTPENLIELIEAAQ